MVGFLTSTAQQPELSPEEFLDGRLREMFEAAGKTGVDPADIHTRIKEERPTIDHVAIYDALQRAKSQAGLGLIKFHAGANTTGSIRYRLPPSHNSNPAGAGDE